MTWKQHTTSELADLQRAAHLQSLQDEEIGVRHRINNFYLPLFLAHSRERRRHPRSLRVLDCGCGNGASVEYLAAAGFEVFGIDFASFRVEQWQGRSHLPAVHLLAADATALPFPDRYFDIVFSCGMLEHIGVIEACTPDYRVEPDPDQLKLRERFLAESFRVLNSQGVLFLDHPNGRFPIDFWHNDYRSLPRFHRPSERFLPSYREVCRLAKSIAPECSIRAISPAGRFTFRRSRRRWYGKLFTKTLQAYFALMKYPPVSRLAASPLNPYLVIRITP
jgi:SAM-dependent methyltransferase